MKPSHFIKLIILLSYTIACANKNPGKNESDNTIEDTVVAANTVIADTFKANKPMC